MERIIARKISREEALQIARGAQLLGCGGGGEITWAQKLIDRIYSEQGDVLIVQIEDVGADSPVVIVGAVGGGVAPADRKKIEGYLEGLTEKQLLEVPLLRAISELEAYTGEKFEALVPTEIGAGNMSTTMFAAAMGEKFIINGDCCGRAKPMISISTTRLAGISPTPLCAVNAAGDVMILKDAVDDVRAEDVVRRFAVSSGGVCFCARCPSTAKKYSRGMVRGSFSRCLRLGKALKKAERTSADPVEAITSVEEGARVLFRGTISSHKKKESGGFITGSLKVRGTGRFRGQKLEAWFKNEFAVCYVEEEFKVSVPDLILVYNHRTNLGVSNFGDSKDQRGDPVTVLEIPADPLWQGDPGRNIFSLENVRGESIRDNTGGEKRQTEGSI